MERRSRCKLSKLGLNASTPNSTLLQSCLEEAQKQATNLPQNCTLAGLKGIELCFAKLWPATMFCLNLLCLLFALALAWPSFGFFFHGATQKQKKQEGSSAANRNGSVLCSCLQLQPGAFKEEQQQEKAKNQRTKCNRQQDKRDSSTL